VPQHGGEVVEDILLVCQVALQVPRFAVFSSAAQIGDRDDETLVEQHTTDGTERGGQARAVAAVAGDQRGIRSVALSPFGDQDVDRHLGSVVGNCKFAHNFDVAKSDGRFCFQRSIFGLPVLCMKAVIGRGLDVGRVAEEHVVALQAGQPAAGGQRRLLRSRHALPRQIEDAQFRRAAELI